MFDMLQDEVANHRSENVSLKVDISRLHQRVTFLFSFFDLQEVNTSATTQAAGSSQFQPYWMVHLPLTLQAQKHLLTL